MFGPWAVSRLEADWAPVGFASNSGPRTAPLFDTMRFDFRKVAMSVRRQRTIARPAAVSGWGFFTGSAVTLRFLPADDNFGIAFQRVDLPGTAPIPARLDYVVPRLRRTAISRQ